jgi:hypothetical protein
VHLDWTPEPDFRADRPRKGIGPRNSTSALTTANSGRTPEVPRKSTSDGSGSERTSTTFLTQTEAREVREGEVIDITRALAAAISMKGPKEEASR